MPAPAGQLEWIGGDALMAADFRGKVTVIQSLGGRAGGRALAEKVKKALPEGVMLLGLHTPEGADKAQGVFGQNPPCLIAVDRNGEWCDALGIWKRPVNLVIDKTGAVRFVGLSDLGLKSKLEALLAEEVDDSVVAKAKPDVIAKPAAATDAPTAWPTFTNAVGGIDVRGKTLPQFVVQKWITRQPDPAGRLVAIDFWATWCPPCRASIPHLNEIQGKFGNDLLVVGVSDETSSKFEQGLKKQDLKENQFQYSLALDPAQRMYKFFGPGGIPHMALLSPDMVVRWQGHPATLQDTDLQKLVDANRALSKTTPNTGSGQRGWVKGTSPTAR
jgi:thiol-disulfide isomerase/thioredoxin